MFNRKNLQSFQQEQLLPALHEATVFNRDFYRDEATKFKNKWLKAECQIDHLKYEQATMKELHDRQTELCLKLIKKNEDLSRLIGRTVKFIYVMVLLVADLLMRIYELYETTTEAKLSVCKVKIAALRKRALEINLVRIVLPMFQEYESKFDHGGKLKATHSIDACEFLANVLNVCDRV